MKLSKCRYIIYIQFSFEFRIFLRCVYIINIGIISNNFMFGDNTYAFALRKRQFIYIHYSKYDTYIETPCKNLLHLGDDVISIS